MRVISGSAKGRKFKYPNLSDGKVIRPLSDRAKEGLFNILVNEISDCNFLDLFAGTGQIGIEALSRGAKSATFIEIERKAAVIIKENLMAFGLADRGKVFVSEVIRAISVLNKKRIKFDIVFIGAPYGSRKLDEALEKIAESDILNDNAVVIAERSKRHVINKTYGKLCEYDEAVYGDTILSFYGENK